MGDPVRASIVTDGDLQQAERAAWGDTNMGTIKSMVPV